MMAFLLIILYTHAAVSQSPLLLFCPFNKLYVYFWSVGRKTPL